MKQFLKVTTLARRALVHSLRLAERRRTLAAMVTKRITESRRFNSFRDGEIVLTLLSVPTVIAILAQSQSKMLYALAVTTLAFEFFFLPHEIHITALYTYTGNL